MGLSTSQNQVTWSASNSQSVSAGGNATSDAETIDGAMTAGSVTIKADNGGTPADGDIIEVRILYTNGDPDAEADSADEYDDRDSVPPVLLDTYETDPAIVTLPLMQAKAYKIDVLSQAASNSITVSAQDSQQVWADPS